MLECSGLDVYGVRQGAVESNRNPALVARLLDSLQVRARVDLQFDVPHIVICHPGIPCSVLVRVVRKPVDAVPEYETFIACVLFICNLLFDDTDCTST